MNNAIVTIKSVRGYQDEKGVAQLNLEDVARGLGFTQIKSGIEYIRWETVRGYLKEFNFPTSWENENLPEYIPENIFYKLCFKAKNEIARRFQDIVTDEVLPSIRKTGMYIAKPKKQYHKPIDKAIKQHFNIAETFIQATGVKPELVYAVAINEAEKETGYSYDEYKKLLPSAKHDVASYNPTQIGELLGNSKAKEVNKRLEELGLQEKKNNVWRLTEQGRQYGEEKPFSRFGHTDYRILWHEKVVEVLEVK